MKVLELFKLGGLAFNESKCLRVGDSFDDDEVDILKNVRLVWC